MHLTFLTLRQFRNYGELTLEVDQGVNLFLGPNGSGKTNCLEALAVLTTGVSPRGAETDALFQWGKDGFYLKGQFGYDGPDRDPLTLEMKFRLGSSRVIRQNSQTVVRLRDLMGRVPLVCFVPEDLALVKGEPVGRRKAINMVLAQIDPLYGPELKKYNDTVRSRNAALRQLAEGQISAQALVPWDEALIDVGLKLCQKRALFIQEFSEVAGHIHARISGGVETMGLTYLPSFPGPWDETARDRWRQKILSIRSQEMAVGATMTGPHRDDVQFMINGRPAKSFGSEGQKRTAAVAFKLAEIPTIQEKRGEKPICLLDDVLSELDANRAKHLLDELSRTSQCFVTLTGLESWPEGRERPASIFRVSSDGIKRERSPEAAVAL